MTNKTIVVENTGEVDEAVRISFTESWTTHNNGTLNGWIHPDGTKSTHTTETELSTDESVAILNLANTSDWTKVGDYYYYNYKLAPGESTTSFLESVTFNSKTKLDDTCETTIDGSTKTITCSSSGDDYDNATYTLTLNIETVQYNKYNEAWNLNNTVTIASTSKPVQTYCVYEAGDEITYDNEVYNVLQNSDNRTNYVVALKSEALTAEQVNTYHNYYTSISGEYPYYRSDTCDFERGIYSGCINNYDESFAKIIVDGWSDNYGEDLVSIDNYKARLISTEDLNNLGYTFYMNTGNLKIGNDVDTYDSWIFKKYLYTIVHIGYIYDYYYYGYYGMSAVDDLNSIVLGLNVKDGNIRTVVDNLDFIRPVINLKKSAIESECPTH